MLVKCCLFTLCYFRSPLSFINVMAQVELIIICLGLGDLIAIKLYDCTTYKQVIHAVNTLVVTQ